MSKELEEKLLSNCKLFKNVNNKMITNEETLMQSLSELSFELPNRNSKEAIKEEDCFGITQSKLIMHKILNNEL